MSKRRAKPDAPEPAGRRLSRRHVLLLLLIVAAVTLLLLGRPSYALWLTQRARSQLRAGALSPALQNLERAAALAPRRDNIELLRAFGYRQLHQLGAWQQALDAAQAKGASRSDVQRERQLYRIQVGDWPPGAESELEFLSDGAVTEDDVPATYVAGCLAANRLSMAKRILDAWAGTSGANAPVAYMTGQYLLKVGDRPGAEQAFQRAVTLASRHELARVALAELQEGNHQLRAALEQFLTLGRISPHCEQAAVGAARVLRKMGYPDRAQAALAPFARSNGATELVEAELGRIAMEQGNLQVAEQSFAAANVQRSWDPDILISAVRLFGLLGEVQQAEQLFQRVATMGNSVTRTGDLRIRLQVDPADKQAAEEIAALQREVQAKMSEPADAAAEALANLPEQRRLFMLHCADCHGEDGSGNGRAARHLFPYPRDLRRERSRLVSTRNGVPTREDTLTVLRRGIPGTSMPAYDQLTEHELRLLAEEVQVLRRAGLRDQYLQELAYFEEPVDEADVQQFVERMSTPGEVIQVPPMGPASAASLERGQQIYIQQACHSCHGEDGAGLANQQWYDERGFAVRTRDLAREPLKGSQDAAAVYLRIAAGMPGTPHPANTTLSEHELADVVHYCLSLSREPKRQLTDFQRAALATGRDYVGAEQ